MRPSLVYFAFPLFLISAFLFIGSLTATMAFGPTAAAVMRWAALGCIVLAGILLLVNWLKNR